MLGPGRVFGFVIDPRVGRTDRASRSGGKTGRRGNGFPWTRKTATPLRGRVKAPRNITEFRKYHTACGSSSGPSEEILRGLRSQTRGIMIHKDRSKNLSESLLESGRKALEHAAELLKEGRSELSCITFGVGIELTLKSRLAFEHWHLVIEDDKPKEDCWDKLQKGNVKTVGATKLLRLLTRLVPKEELRKLSIGKLSLEAMARLRNRAAHFGLQPETDRTTLAATQLKAWYALQDLAKVWPSPLKTLAEKVWESLREAIGDLEDLLDTKAEASAQKK